MGLVPVSDVPIHTPLISDPNLGQPGQLRVGEPVSGWGCRHHTGYLLCPATTRRCCHGTLLLVLLPRGNDGVVVELLCHALVVGPHPVSEHLLGLLGTVHPLLEGIGSCNDPTSYRTQFPVQERGEREHVIGRVAGVGVGVIEPPETALTHPLSALEGLEGFFLI